MNESLLYRVARRCRCCHIRHTSLTCLVGKKSTSDTNHNCGTNSAARYLFYAKSIVNNQFQYVRNLMNIHDDYYHGKHHIANSHDRYDNRTDMGNALDATKDNQQRHDDHNHSHPCGRPSKGFVHSTANRVCLNGDTGETKLNGDKHSKQYGHPTQVQTTINIIGGTSDERIFVLLLV